MLRHAILEVGGFSTAANKRLWGHSAHVFADIKPYGPSRVILQASHVPGQWRNDTEAEAPFASDQALRSTPIMPSQMFQRMARSQLELLVNSLIDPSTSSRKASSMALYLPQENVNTGQLEFIPVVLYPDPTTERVFIASEFGSGLAPTLPKTLTALPGFQHATSLLPGYPMISSSIEPGVGVVEEVLCDIRSKTKAAALSVPLLSGSQTVGVLLVSPAVSREDPGNRQFWTEFDREQVSRAAQSLSMALSMDTERNILKDQNDQFRQGLSDSLHQVKNPLQALRTYGKLLQRQIVSTQEATDSQDIGVTPQLLALAESLMTQSDRVVDLLVPLDSLADPDQSRILYLNPAQPDATARAPLVLRAETPVVDKNGIRNQRATDNTLEFSRRQQNATVVTGFESHPTTSSEVQHFGNTTDGSNVAPLPYNEVAPGIRERPPTLVGDVELEMTFVVDVLAPIFDAFSVMASERGIHFEVVEESQDMPGVIAAPKSLQEAVANVLDNAIKYVGLPKSGSPFDRNPTPKVRVRLAPNSKPLKPGVTIVVEDNGPGIQEKDRLAIFERGYRAESTSGVDGSGIGLDICIGLMQRMGGFLTAIQPEECPGCLDGAIMKFVLFRNPEVDSV